MTRTLVLLGMVGLCAAGPVSATPTLWPGNGNYYDYVPSSLTWQQAKAAAESTTFLGMNGHLATVTSSDENSFINTTFNTGVSMNFAWIGGWEPNDDGVWRWAVGPESGIQFSYSNWGGIEPNDFKANEDFTMFNIGLTLGPIAPGQWADASPTPTFDPPELADPVVGYVVEYEIVPEPTSMVLPVLAAALARRLGRIPKR